MSCVRALKGAAGVLSEVGHIGDRRATSPIDKGNISYCVGIPPPPDVSSRQDERYRWLQRASKLLTYWKTWYALHDAARLEV